jgi:hypothetical protein
MPDEMMNLRSLLEQSPDADFLHEMIAFAAQRLSYQRSARPIEPNIHVNVSTERNLPAKCKLPRRARTVSRRAASFRRGRPLGVRTHRRTYNHKSF